MKKHLGKQKMHMRNAVRIDNLWILLLLTGLVALASFANAGSPPLKLSPSVKASPTLQNDATSSVTGFSSPETIIPSYEELGEISSAIDPRGYWHVVFSDESSYHDVTNGVYGDYDNLHYITNAPEGPSTPLLIANSIVIDGSDGLPLTGQWLDQPAIAIGADGIVHVFYRLSDVEAYSGTIEHIYTAAPASSKSSVVGWRNY